MSAKRVLRAVLVASLAVLAVTAGPRVASIVRALPLHPAQSPAGVTIHYAGRLADEAGMPVPEQTRSKLTCPILFCR